MSVVIIIMIIISIFTYLIILGASKCKSEEEQRMEDMEQIEYLNKSKNGGKHIEK